MKKLKAILCYIVNWTILGLHEKESKKREGREGRRGNGVRKKKKRKGNQRHGLICRCWSTLE